MRSGSSSRRAEIGNEAPEAGLATGTGSGALAPAPRGGVERRPDRRHPRRRPGRRGGNARLAVAARRAARRRGRLCASRRHPPDVRDAAERHPEPRRRRAGPAGTTGLRRSGERPATDRSAADDHARERLVPVPDGDGAAVDLRDVPPRRDDRNRRPVGSRASPRCSHCSCASTNRPRGGSCSTVSICARSGMPT